MEHTDIRHKLSEYIDNEIAPEERAAIEAHLAVCNDCAQALRELNKTVEHLHALSDMEVPAWLTARTMATVRKEKRGRKILQSLFFPLAIKVPLQAVAVLFLAVTAFYIYEGMHPAALSVPQEQKLEKRLPAASAPKVTQTPGYRALDMKNEYERPPLPGPGAPTHATAKEGAAARQNMASRPVPPQATARQEAGPVHNFEQKGAARTGEQRAGTPSLASDGLLPREGTAGNEDLVGHVDAMHIVTAYFWEHDLRQDMKVRGLQYVTRRLPDDLAGVEWLVEMRSYRKTPCKDRYIVDVELSGLSSKYLYCYESGKVRLIGVYDLVSAVWMERK
jgi:hypothetical protein